MKTSISDHAVNNSNNDEDRIIMEERIGICAASVVQIHQTMPRIMKGHVSNQDWESFCSKVDKDLKRFSNIRPMVAKLFLLWLVIVGAYFIAAEVFNLLNDYRYVSLLVEILVSVGILLAVTLVYSWSARYFAIRAVKHHCHDFDKYVCSNLELTCHFPFCQLTGGITKGWYIAIQPKKAGEESTNPEDMA